MSLAARRPPRRPRPNTPPSGPLTTETWANASAPSTLTKPMPSGLQRTTAPPRAFLKRAGLQQLIHLLVKAKQASYNSPVFSTFSVLPWPSSILSAVTILPGPWCSRPPLPTGRSPSARQCLGQRQGQAPRNLSAVDTRHAPLPY